MLQEHHLDRTRSVIRARLRSDDDLNIVAKTGKTTQNLCHADVMELPTQHEREFRESHSQYLGRLLPGPASFLYDV